MMASKDRADAIGRAERAFKALADHPESTRRQLGVAREHVNDCYRLPDAGQVWESVAAVENTASGVYGVPHRDEQPTAGGPAPAGHRAESPVRAETVVPAVPR